MHYLPSLITTTSLVFITGLLLIPAFLIFRMQWDSDWLMELPITSGTIRLWINGTHAFFGWLMIGFIGSLWTIHMRNHWRRNENRKGGVLFMLLWAIIIASSLLIYYASNEILSQYSSIIHTLLGVIAPIALIAHRSKGKRSLVKKKSS